MTTPNTTRRISLERVLFATDFSLSSSEIVLSHASAIARRYRSKLYMAHVTPPELYKSVPHELLKEAVEKHREHVRHEMAHLIRSGGLRKLRHQTILEEGDVADVLLRLVREHAIDLLVVGTRGHRGVKRMLLGSVAEKIYRQSPCPVLIVPPPAREQVRVSRILYPTDFSPHSLQAAPYAVSLANHHRAKLILLHVVEGVTLHSVADLNQRRRLVENRLKKLVLGNGELELKPELEVEFGDAAQKIYKVASQWQAGLIVLAVRLAKPASAHLTAGTAYKVVRRAPCPVLTVRRKAQDA
jgi:nucleotide-binding universal stress UspA family protein